jgi:apolipoprotein N-acyltransferase
MSIVWATLSGLLCFLAMPSWLTGAGTDTTSWFSWPWLSFIGTVPLLVVAAREPSRWRRFRLGWLCGTVLLATMQHHIADTLVLMSHVPWAAAIPAMLVYAAWAGLPWGLVAMAVRPVRTLVGPSWSVLVIPALAVVLERSFPALFPFYASSGFFDQPFILQSADIIGIAGVSLLIHAVRVAVAEQVIARLEGHNAPRLAPALVAGAWALALGYGAIRLNQVEQAPTRTTLELLTIQPNMTVAQKTSDDLRVREVVFEATVRQTTDAIAQGGTPDLVVWPEGGFPFVYDPAPVPIKPNRPQRYSERMRRFAAGLGVDVISGGLAKAIDDRATNSALLFAKAAPAVQRYDKQRLLMFGEHVPFADWFPNVRRWVPGMSHHVAGTEFARWTAGGARIAPTICYEAVFQDFTRDAVAAGDAELIVNLTNEVWFGETTAGPQHAMVQSARAIELRRWLVRSANSGLSMFIAPTGAIVAQSGVGIATTLRHTLAIPELPSTVFAAIGDAFLWLCAAISALVIGREVRRRRVA